MKIASWNVNSIKARLANATDWVREARPDVLLLQEIKCQDADFPVLEFQSLGYQVHAHGQKSYNGLAVLSRDKHDDVTTRQARAGRSDGLRARQGIGSTCRSRW